MNRPDRHQAIIDCVIALADTTTDRIEVKEIAQKIGIPDRSLREIWARKFGTSPGQYLRRRRMALARCALLKAQRPEKVTDIAMEHGFYQLGWFSVHYRQRYGESPSATIRSD
jgi:transcriptional regulator GlxA family with amidase domain